MSWRYRFVICACFLLSGVSVSQANDEIGANNGEGCPVEDQNKRQCAGGNGTCARTCTQKALGCVCL
jgi:hypothetical protein